MSAPAGRTARAHLPLVQVEKLTKLYPLPTGLGRKAEFVHALESASFYVRRGEIFGIVGESGSGKSTLARTMLRLAEPTFGRVTFDGVDLMALSGESLRKLRRRMQLVFQDPGASLNPRLTAGESVGEGLAIHRLARTKREAEEMVAAELERVGLRADMRERYPHEFSGGQRQRLALARALAVKPEFLVCDEPVSALDVSVQAQIVNLIIELQERLDLAVVFITHDLRVVQWVAHRLAVMLLGRIVEMGPAADVATKRHHPYSRVLWSSMPQGPEKRRLGVVLEGEPPDPKAPPPGCVFHPRCPRAEKGKCDVEAPALEEIVPGSHHRVACWHPEV